MRDYRVITSWDYDILADLVNKALLDGWTCCGGVAVCGNDRDGYKWAQAMVKFGRD